MGPMMFEPASIGVGLSVVAGYVDVQFSIEPKEEAGVGIADPHSAGGNHIKEIPSAAKMPESPARFRLLELAWGKVHCKWNSPSRCSSRCSR